MNFAFSLSSRLLRAELAWAALPFDVYFTAGDFLLQSSTSKPGSSDPPHPHNPATTTTPLILIMLRGTSSSRVNFGSSHSHQEQPMLPVLSMTQPRVFQALTLEVKDM